MKLFTLSYLWLTMLLVVVLGCGNLLAQKNTSTKNPSQKNINNVKQDTIRYKRQIINDSINTWCINQATRIWQCDTTIEIWNRNRKATVWAFNNSTDVWYINEVMKLWKVKDSISVYEMDKKKGDWFVSDTVTPLVLNDTLKIWTINDSIKFATIEKRSVLFHVIKWTKYWIPSPVPKQWKLTDSTKLRWINDTMAMWTFRDTIDRLVNKVTKLNFLSISSNTDVWTVGKDYEIWRVKDSIQLWSKNSKTFEWEKNTAIKRWHPDDTTFVWETAPNQLAWYTGKELGLWKINTTKKVWSLNDSIKIWQVAPPPPKIVPVKDTVITLPVKKTTKQMSVGESTRVWVLNDSTKVWKFKRAVEVWTLDYKPTVWIIDSINFVWTLNDKYKISILQDTTNLWKLDDATGVWNVDNSMQFWQVNDSCKVWTVNDNTRLEKIFPDNMGKIWNVNKSVKLGLFNLNDTHHYIRLNDTSSVWFVDATKRFVLSNDTVIVWQIDNSCKNWKINDSTQIIQIDDNNRVSTVNNMVKFWRKVPKAESWSIYLKIKENTLNDTISVWDIDKGVQVWKINDSIAIWRVDKNTKVWSIDDSTKVWTFTVGKAVPQPKKPVFWKVGGDGGLQFSQVYFKDWAKPADDEISTLNILKLYANYSKNKLSFDNNAQVQLGINRKGGLPIRKAKDYFELDTKVGFKAFKHWYYSAQGNLKSQIFRGYYYPTGKPRELNSLFLSPGIVQFGIGMDYKPTPSFSLVLSPLTSKITLVLASDSALIQTKINNKVDTDKMARMEKGGSMTVRWGVNITKEINMENRVELFSNYQESIDAIDVRWDATMAMKINKYLSTNIKTQLIWDQDIMIPIFDKKDGIKVPRMVTDANGKSVQAKGARVQFNEVLSVGFSYKF